MSSRRHFEAARIRTSSDRRAFTLVELLVAIGIIVILVALTVGVGTAVANSGRERATEGALQTLDQVLDAYIQAKGGNPPAFVRVDESAIPTSSLVSAGKDGFFPLFDGYSEDDERAVNTVGLFLIAARSVPTTEDIIAGLDPKFVRRFQPGATADALQPEATTIFDAWGNPFRMVHPRFDGEILASSRTTGDPGNAIDIAASSSTYLQGIENRWSGDGQLGLENLRRNALNDADRQQDSTLVGDSDGGICPSPRPYFYSAGPDGDPSTTDDNIYTTRPRFES